MTLSNTTAFQKVGSRPYERPFPGCERHPLFSDTYYECFLRQATQTQYHPAGTVKMGPKSDRSAVVDHELRQVGENERNQYTEKTKRKKYRLILRVFQLYNFYN